MRIDIGEVYRYLGYHGLSPDDVVAAAVRECIGQVEAAADLRCVRKRVPVTFEKPDSSGDGGLAVNIGTMRVRSGMLYRHLEGCSEAYMFAATIGIGVDRLIRRAEVAEVSRAVMLQAAGAAAVEAWCDEIDEEIRREIEAEGKRARRRYSPGYGDFALSYQAEFLRMLNASKEIGITLTDGYLMIPSKSVTAIIGIGSERFEEDNDGQESAGSAGSNCAGCAAADCQYRKV